MGARLNAVRPTLASMPAIYTRPLQQRAAVSAVFIPPTLFWVPWILVLSIHIIVASFVATAGFSHLALCYPAVDAASTRLRIPFQVKFISGLSYLLVTAFHVRAVAVIILKSIRARRLTLGYKKPTHLLRSSPTTHLLATPSLLKRAQSRLILFWTKLFGRDGYFGINGMLFEKSLALRECLEIAMQSYQLWSLSRAVPQAWINNFDVTTVVANCWSMFFVGRIFSKTSETSRRLIHLVVDMYLDLVCTVVVPVFVLAKYLIAFDWKTLTFPVNLLADDLWVASSIAESRQVLVTSYLDFVASLLPHYSIYNCLRLIERLLHRRHPRTTPSKPSQTSDNSSLDGLAVEATRFATRAFEKDAGFVRAASLCMAAWGAIILSLHIHAQVHALQVDGCRLYLRPWLATNVSCSVMYINCNRREMGGSPDALDEVLNQLERRVVVIVAFAHCSTLQIPVTITQFPLLDSVIIQQHDHQLVK